MKGGGCIKEPAPYQEFIETILTDFRWSSEISIFVSESAECYVSISVLRTSHTLQVVQHNDATTYVHTIIRATVLRGKDSQKVALDSQNTVIAQQT